MLHGGSAGGAWGTCSHAGYQLEVPCYMDPLLDPLLEVPCSAGGAMLCWRCRGYSAHSKPLKMV